MWIIIKILGMIGFIIAGTVLLGQTNHDVTSYISYLIAMIFYTIFLIGVFEVKLW